jgi:hypothetical protein
MRRRKFAIVSEELEAVARDLRVVQAVAAAEVSDRMIRRTGLWASTKRYIVDSS